jgi:hypothetical protein
MVKISIKWFFIIVSLFFIVKCAKIDPVTGEKVIIEPNVTKRQQAFIEKEGGIFGDFNRKNQSNTFEFATSNVLWRATLKSLDFLPLVNADYSGGIIIYDWYSDGKNNKEQIKVSVKFLNNELRSDSLEVSVHKKICDNENNCITQKINNNFNQEIKDTIISSARSLKISEQKNNK